MSRSANPADMDRLPQRFQIFRLTSITPLDKMSNVRIVTRKTLQDFWQSYPDAEKALREWHKVASARAWKNLMEVRLLYPHADAVKLDENTTLTVFNICGNKYRLIVRIKYEWQLINVRSVLTHREYDLGKWKE